MTESIVRPRPLPILDKVLHPLRRDVTESIVKVFNSLYLRDIRGMRLLYLRRSAEYVHCITYTAHVGGHSLCSSFLLQSLGLRPRLLSLFLFSFTSASLSTLSGQPDMLSSLVVPQPDSVAVLLDPNCGAGTAAELLVVEDEVDCLDSSLGRLLGTALGDVIPSGRVLLLP